MNDISEVGAWSTLGGKMRYKDAQEHLETENTV
jgi:hypothetical protein